MDALSMEALSYALKLGGVLFLLLAAIGVLRLPDAFTRMHAATKAGTLGAGLVVLGSALSLRGIEAIGLAVVTLVILLATVPLASHLLARAAYTSGAPFWRGTARDALEGTLRRGGRAGTDDLPPPPPGPVPTRITRIVVAPTHGSSHAAATRAAQIADATGLPEVTLGLLDPRGLDPAACRTARERLEQTVDSSVSLAPAGTAIELREGVPDDAVLQMARPGDLFVLPATGWYDHGTASDETGRDDPLSGRGETTLALAHNAPRPVLLASERPHVKRIVVLDDGSDAVPAALAALADLDPFPGAAVRVTWEAGTEETQERRDVLLRAAGSLDLGFRAPSGDGPVREDDDLLVCRRVPGAARGDWYGSDWRDRFAPGWRGGVLLV